MQLNTNRIFNDRLVWDEKAPEKLRVKSSFWDWCKRIISHIWSPASYTEENKRTVRAFKKYLVDTLGADRLQRICSRYGVDLNAAHLNSRMVAQIVIGTKVVTLQDVAEKYSVEQLSSEKLSQAVTQLSTLFDNHWKVAHLWKSITGKPSNLFARIFYDPFLADRERLYLTGKEHPTFHAFLNHMSAKIINREMVVGTLVPVRIKGQPEQFYTVSGKLITGQGMVSYILRPATKDTRLEPIRLFRGTLARNSEIDGISSVITDFERKLGKSAFESGVEYEKYIQDPPKIEAGHSLGSALVQYRLAHSDHIEKAYLFNGPGIPEEEVLKFNKKKSKAHLFIRQSTKDIVAGAGEVHLGYQADSDQVHFLKYHAPRKKLPQSAHGMVYEMEPKTYYGVEGGWDPKKRDQELYHKYHLTEVVRSLIGPIIACALRIFRDIYRCFCLSRAQIEQGLKLGRIQNGRWQVEHFRPKEYTSKA